MAHVLRIKIKLPNGIKSLKQTNLIFNVTSRLRLVDSETTTVTRSEPEKALFLPR